MRWKRSAIILIMHWRKTAMNNKKVFSTKMFWQTFKQLKFVGILLAAIIVIFDVISFSGEMLSYFSYASVDGGIGVSKMDVSPFQIYLFLTFLIFTPIIAISTWNFQNKRNSSDFYHSLSYTRGCLYLSRFAAAFTWVFIMLAASCVVRLIAYGIFNNYLIIDYAMLFKIYGSMFVCNVFILAAVTLACSVTGNIFANICVTGLITFLPGFLINLCAGAVSTVCSLVPADYVIPFISRKSNLVMALFMCLFDNSDINNILTSVFSNIYTLVIAIIYLIAGYLIFARRKSECAGKAANGVKTRFAIKTMLCFAVLSAAVVTVVLALNGEAQISWSIFAYIAAVLFMTIAVVIYEAVTSKNAKKIISCIPSLLTAVILSILFGIGINTACGVLKSQTIDSQKVEYVRFSSADYSYYDEENYFDSLTEKIDVDDKDIINTFCEAYEDSVELMEEIKKGNYYISDNYVKYEVYFADGKSGKHRYVYLDKKKLGDITDGLQNVEEYRQAYMSLPDFKNVTLRVAGMNALDEKEQERIYDTLVEEIRKMSFSQWYEAVNMTGEPLGSLIFTFRIDGQKYRQPLSLSNLLPKTSEMVYNILNEESRKDEKSYNELKKAIDDLMQGKQDVIYDYKNELGYREIYADIMTSEGVVSSYSLVNLKNDIDVYNEILKSSNEALNNDNYNISLDEDKTLIRLYYNCYDGNECYETKYYVQLDKKLNFNEITE